MRETMRRLKNSKPPEKSETKHPKAALFEKLRPANHEKTVTVSLSPLVLPASLSPDYSTLADAADAMEKSDKEFAKVLDSLEQLVNKTTTNNAPPANSKSPSTGDLEQNKKTSVYQARDDDFKEWFKDNKELARSLEKPEIHKLLIKRNSKIWQSGFKSWWDYQTIYKATRGRKKSNRNRMT
jgi:hypothetical protein